ncbi:MAG: SpoIIE family protein phosphatase [Leptospiraceae bacterium]|nr:SpoIIE family protein phosphatase [Leptospiraceae bacterium]MDW8306785.1 SpoIIE family protein phosphatase [Leptospiraceae bacterium]
MSSFVNKISQISIRKRLWLMALLFISSLFLATGIGLLNQFRHHEQTDDALISAETVTRAVDTARSAQVAFKKQVQEWKNTLLRAHDPELRQKYWSQFEKEEKNVLKYLEELRYYFQKLNLEVAVVDRAIEEHIALGEKYREKVRFLKTGIFATTFMVDASVRGIDRSATDYIDQLVKLMEDTQNKKFSAVRREAALSFWAILIFTLLTASAAIVFLFVVAFLTIKSITEPISQTIHIFDSISNDNLHNQIDEKRKDEIGEMWRALAIMQNRLRERTESLNRSNQMLHQTLQQVQAIKEKQDGDYFLTSLLSRPLCSVKSSHPALRVSHYIRQKKTFSFRKWNREIGGDINIADEIELRGRVYLVMLNADAMGKSIQGAGGAIVMGALFRSILERTKMSPQVAAQYPERWLKNTWSEIQKVFESFDGSMLVSAVIALLDVETGVLYSINAEHPHIVLYRDKTASFLHTDYTSRKFGTMLTNNRIEIFVNPLSPGDIIILGSDGRDDLMITDEQGNAKMNEDETLFLRIVHEAEGVIDRIVLGLQEKGEITDDLSLLVVEYVGAPSSSKNELSSHEHKALDGLEVRESQRQLILNFMRKKEYQQVIKFGNIYLERYPFDNEMMYIVSYACKMARDYETAAEYGERLRLRDMGFFKNLVNLADIHLQRRDFRRASELLAEAEELDPQNENIAKLRNALQSSKAGLSVS